MERNISIFFVFSAVILILASCAKQQAITPEQPNQPQPKIDKPAEQPKVEQPKPTISPEVSDLLSKHKTKVQSISYKYNGPESGDFLYDFHIKGQKIKYSPTRNIKYFEEEDSYNYIFIDKTAKTAESYCLEACSYPGKKSDLNYEEVYIPTIFDWLDGLANAEKAGEEVIDGRSTWKLDTNKGLLWIDTFYGIPLKAESNGRIYRFQQVSVNSVTDEDVSP